MASLSVGTPYASATVATFPGAGTYVPKLTGNDGGAEGSDAVTYPGGSDEANSKFSLLEKKAQRWGARNLHYPTKARIFLTRSSNSSRAFATAWIWPPPMPSACFKSKMGFLASCATGTRLAKCFSIAMQ